MKIYIETNLTRYHMTIFFHKYKSQNISKVTHENSVKSQNRSSKKTEEIRFMKKGSRPLKSPKVCIISFNFGCFWDIFGFFQAWLYFLPKLFLGVPTWLVMCVGDWHHLHYFEKLLNTPICLCYNGRERETNIECKKR